MPARVMPGPRHALGGSANVALADRCWGRQEPPAPLTADYIVRVVGES
jgi:hypothetical protein